MIEDVVLSLFWSVPRYRDTTRQRAYQEFGPGQGAIVSLFRKIWKDYQDSNA